MKNLNLHEAAQHSVHPTGGSLRVFRQFAWLGVVSVTMALSRPAHQRVTHTVGRSHYNNIIQSRYKTMSQNNLNMRPKENQAESVQPDWIDLSMRFAIFMALLLVYLGLFFLPGDIIISFVNQSACIAGYGRELEVSIPPYVNILLILACLGFAWVLAYKSKNLGTINGVGTRLIGNQKTPNGYVATKWLVFMFLPMLPVRSYEIFREQQGISNGLQERTYYSMQALPQLAKDQIIATFKKSLILYLLIIALFVGLALSGTWKCF